MSKAYYWNEESQEYFPATSSVVAGMGYVPSYTGTDSALCPDLLRLSDIGEADNWRGRVVRGFFRLLGWVTGV